VQGYNAQLVCTEDQIVIAADVTQDSPDFGQLEPMITAARDELARAGVTDPPDVVLADAGYWHQIQIERLVSDGMVVLIPPDAKKRSGARPGWDGGPYAFMRRVLATERGGGLDSKRQTMIEPVFADTKFNRRIDRFLRRGRSAARSEWRLTNAAHKPAQALATHHRADARLSWHGGHCLMRTDRSTLTQTAPRDPNLFATASAHCDSEARTAPSRPER
jgi:Transposase DDE domain